MRADNITPQLDPPDVTQRASHAWGPSGGHPRSPGWAADGATPDTSREPAIHPQMGSKAETLARLEGRLVSARVLPQVTFTVAEWRRDAAAVIAKIQSAFPDVMLVVRSSAQAEDTFEHSNAGAFESRLGVTNAPSALRIAVEAVIASYSAGANDD